MYLFKSIPLDEISQYFVKKDNGSTVIFEITPEWLANDSYFGAPLSIRRMNSHFDALRYKGWFHFLNYS